MHSAFRQAGVKQRPGEIGAASLLWDCPWHGQDEDVSLRHPHVVPVLVPHLWAAVGLSWQPLKRSLRHASSVVWRPTSSQSAALQVARFLAGVGLHEVLAT